jgi:hypothetical protein
MSKETAKEIRTALKAEGMNAKKVGVRNHSYSMGSTVHVEIKCPLVNVSKVREIAESFQKVSVCEYTQETLSGGNTFVMVEFSSAMDGYFQDLGALFLARAEKEGVFTLNSGHQVEKGDCDGELTAWKIDGDIGTRVNAMRPAGVARAIHAAM